MIRNLMCGAVSGLIIAFIIPTAAWWQIAGVVFTVSVTDGIFNSMGEK